MIGGCGETSERSVRRPIVSSGPTREEQRNEPWSNLEKMPTIFSTAVWRTRRLCYAMRGGELIYLRGSVLKGYNLQIPRFAEFIGSPLPFHYNPLPGALPFAVPVRSFSLFLSIIRCSPRCLLGAYISNPWTAGFGIADDLTGETESPVLPPPSPIMIIIESELLD